jgi:hypothetical protein
MARLSAQPAITSVTNAASNILAGLSNAGIAQGDLCGLWERLGPREHLHCSGGFTLK